MLILQILYFALQDKGRILGETAKQYSDGSIPIENPREEAAEIMMELKRNLVVDWAKDLSDLVKLSASLYNLTLSSRR